MEFKVILDEGAFLPKKAYERDAGYDLKTPYFFVLCDGDYAIVDTGVHIEIPNGYYGKLESKSGLAMKHGILCPFGVIDSGFTGSVKVYLYNNSNRLHYFDKGDKIAQIVFMPCLTPELRLVRKFEKTERGDNGYGSTGQ